MAITQLNTADFDYAMMLNVINKSYKGKADITLSAYNTTAAPDVKVGSVFEDNGAIFIVDTADITPTGYAGITNSTTFYLYYDESGSVFIYSNTAPSWSDVLQGWYNGNDRAFFSMFKDSGGTLYQSKIKMSINGDISTRTKIIQIGDWNMVATNEINIAHGLAHSTIRHLSVMIRHSSGSHYEFGTDSLGGSTNDRLFAGTTNITISRATGGVFDTSSYEATSYNRGWIIIQYVG